MKIILLSVLVLPLLQAKTHGTDRLIESYYRNRRSPDQSYQQGGGKTVDLHGDQFCVDISSFGPITWVEEPAEECATPFVKKCEDKTENVCKEVLETKCQVVPYTVCKMGLEPIEFSETELAPVAFEPQECITKRKEVPHTKMLPECRNVTKQNCVTLWETDSYGKQVWAGNENCEPVTWQECKLVPRDVKFIVPEVECTPQDPIWYHVPQAKTDIRMTNTMTCEVKSTTDCKAYPRNDCKVVRYQECKEIPVPGCKPAKVHRPTQERIHRKKCLLPDNPAPATSDYGAPPAPLPTYATQPSYSGSK